MLTFYKPLQCSLSLHLFSHHELECVEKVYQSMCVSCKHVRIFPVEKNQINVADDDDNGCISTPRTTIYTCTKMYNSIRMSKKKQKNTERCHLLSTAVVLFISLLITENILPRAQSFHILSRRAHLMYSHFEAVKCTSNERICAHLPTVLTKHKRRRFPANVQNFQEYVCISQCVCVCVSYIQENERLLHLNNLQ